MPRTSSPASFAPSSSTTNTTTTTRENGMAETEFSFVRKSGSEEEEEDGVDVGPSERLRRESRRALRDGGGERGDEKKSTEGTMTMMMMTPPIKRGDTSEMVTAAEILSPNHSSSESESAAAAGEAQSPESKEEEGGGGSDEEPVPPPLLFGDGVRFGYPAACAREHSCAMDGLNSLAPFPDEVRLALVGKEGGQGERDRFEIEASTWTGLLRFLMWYGDSVILASEEDVANEDSHHCEAALSLEFRRNDEGDGVVRLSINLLAANHPPTPQELSVTSLTPSSGGGKGKGKAKIVDNNINATSAALLVQPHTTFLLPDHTVLPTRLSLIAISLYSLRHLAGIALSTQPSKEPSPSYLALRDLGSAISDLANERMMTVVVGSGSNKSGGNPMGRGDIQRHKQDQERLITRLRDRLRWRKLTSSSSFSGIVDNKKENRDPGTGTGTRLVKTIPPVTTTTTTALRTQPIGRQDRVLLSQGDFDSVLPVGGGAGDAGLSLTG
ncbi:hypothetical protein T439DRAFT_328629 [Meredithblackwellia eburnea MCA 4105]